MGNLPEVLSNEAQLKALRFTVELARERELEVAPGDSLGLAHLEGMLATVESDKRFEKDSGKLGRWLGWAQAALVAGGRANLKELKELNQEAHLSSLETGPPMLGRAD